MKYLYLIVILAFNSQASDKVDLLIDQAIEQAEKETDKQLGVPEYKEKLSKISNELKGNKK